MKVCPLCGENYQPFVDFCFADGEVLAMEQVAAEVVEPEGFDAPPPPKMLQGSQQNAGYTRSATPVPRARRPGRTLVNRPESGGGVYTPPVDEESYEAAAPEASVPEDEEAFESPAMGDEVEEIAAFDDGFGEPDEVVPEPRPEPILPKQKARTPTPSPPPRPVAPPSSDTPVPSDEETGAMGLVLIAAGGVLLVGVVLAIGAVVAGAIFSSDKDDTEVAVLPEPPPDPVEQPRPVEPDPDPIQVGPVDPEPVQPDPEPVQPDPVPVAQPDPVPVAQPLKPDPVVPQPVKPRPDPNDGVAEVTPRPEPRVGLVAFASDPQRALIYVDGTAIGTTPYTTPVAFGQHDLRLEREGYQPFTTKFSVNVPELTLSPFKLVSLAPPPEPEAPAPRPDGPPRKVMFFHTDQGIEVKVNGSADGCTAGARCLTPATFNLPSGGYSVSFTTADGAKKSCRIAIEPGEGTQMVQLHQACP
ncbi:MAG: PEGA domain-containing protein [Alphaproteobacteria bacterium]|nr:PEGA domain-containing protein [Alphaproteobacteria bacterium]